MSKIITITVRILFLPITGFIWLTKTIVNEFIDAVKEGLQD